MGAPQIVLIALWTLSFGLTWAKHGEPKEGNTNAWVTLISIGVSGSILWWGGFWQ